MKKFATLMLALMMLLSCAALGMAEDITLDVIIASMVRRQTIGLRAPA